jgi:hypothetical protein
MSESQTPKNTLGVSMPKNGIDDTGNASNGTPEALQKALRGTYARNKQSSIRFRVSASDKARWQTSAKLAGITLSRWIIEKLNK